MTAVDGESANQNHVYALAAAPGFATNGVSFAACTSGLLRSEDGGQSWCDAYSSLELQQPLACTSVVASPEFAEDRTVFAGALGGALRSVDGGSMWTVATLPSPPPFVVDLAVSPSYRSDGLVFAATMEDGVFRSWDRGESWAAWNFGLLDLNVYSLAISPDFRDDDTLFVGTESGIFRSANGGRAWRETPFPMELAPVLRLAISPHYAQDAAIFAGTESHGVFRSNDSGTTWVKLPPSGTGSVNDLVVCGSSFGSELEILALVGSALLTSADGGDEWSELPLPELDGGTPTCVMAPLGLAPESTILVGLDNGNVVASRTRSTSPQEGQIAV